VATERSSWNTSLPQKLAAKVAAALDADERIVWVGQPGPKLHLAPIVRWRILMFAIVGIVAAGLGLVTEEVLRTVLWIVAGFCWFLVVAGLLLPALWSLGVVQRNYYYLLTNRRALICSRTPYALRLELRSFAADQLQRMACIEREDGSGDLRFGGNDRKASSLREGFMMIANVRDVENLIRRTLRCG
jgi:hypothetical protein